MKTYSGQHILSYHSTQNTPRAYVGKPTCFYLFQDSRNFKKTLLELEKLYNTLIDVEDCEKKLAVLPTGTPLRSQVETEGKEGIRYLGQQLVREDKLRLYLTVRKGKALLIRALRWLNTSQMRVVCATLFQNYPLVSSPKTIYFLKTSRFLFVLTLFDPYLVRFSPNLVPF